MAMANHTDISVHRNEEKLDSQTVCRPGHLVNYWHIGPCWLDLLHIGKLKGQKKSTFQTQITRIKNVLCYID